MPTNPNPTLDDAEQGAIPASSASSSHTLASIPVPVDTEKMEVKGKGSDIDWKDNIVLWDSPSDPSNPLNWSVAKKYRVTVILGLTTLCSGFASSVFSSAAGAIAKEFNVSPQVALFSSSLFLLGYVPGPIIFGPMSETFGRKLVYLPVFLFFCFALATGASKSLAAILVTRFFQGFFASAAVTSVGGSLGDMFNTRDRGSAIVLYSLAVVGGPSLAPLVGASVTQSSLGWRWTQWLTAIMVGTMFVAGVLFVPETNGPILLSRKAARLRRETGHWELHSRQEMSDTSLSGLLHKTLFRPIKMFLTEPMVCAITIYNAWAYAVLYLFFSAVPIIFEEHKGWTPVQGSLPFLGSFVGCLIGAGLNHLYAHYVFGPHLDKHGDQARPEMRLPPMMLGGVLFPLGFILLAWAPTIGQIFGLVFVGTSFLLIFQGGINYLVDTYTVFGASAVASNTFLRSFAASCLPFAASPMFAKLGVGWTCTMLCLFAVVLAAVPFVFYIWGSTLRKRSPFATKAAELRLAGQQSGH